MKALVLFALALPVFSACDAAADQPQTTAPSQIVIHCEGKQLTRMQDWERDYARIEVAYCRENLAFVRFGDTGVLGRGQSVFVEWQYESKWKPIAWGETSHGSFIYSTLEAEGHDARRLATLFPESGLTIPS